MGEQKFISVLFRIDLEKSKISPTERHHFGVRGISEL